MQNQLTRKVIFQTMLQGGFKGKLTSFNCWFRIRFPDYKSRLSQSSYSDTYPLLKTSIFRFNRMTPRRLSIYVCNPRWGICPKSGALSEDHILANDVIDSNELLRTLRALAISFKMMLGQSDPKVLDRWGIQANNSGVGKIKSFIRGVKMDWEAVINVIKYKWTNGIVEGNVNRLKSKKREMYGRSGFELLRRKVCLSVNG